jgi:hypothetical protein
MPITARKSATAWYLTSGNNMITGAHSIIYSTDPAADRIFLRDVLKFPHVDAGEGWLIFALPPAELAVHPTDRTSHQELFLICDDIRVFIQEMEQQGVNCSPTQNQNWGQITYITLPGGGQLGVYQPLHVRPETPAQSARSNK